MAKKTALYEEHVSLGGKIVDFAGWELPVQYTTVIEEHTATREKAGLFDIGHMAEFLVKGIDAFSFLQSVLSRDIRSMECGFAMYSTLLYENGGTIDDLFVYRLMDNDFMLVVNAANQKKDWDWLLKNKGDFEVEFEDVSDKTAKIDIQGPESKSILQKLTGDLELPERFYFIKNKIKSIEAIISRTGYTGEDGFEIYCDNHDAVDLWRMLLEAGKDDGLVPCGLGARDSLRIESGYSLYGHELTDDITPVEASIRFVIGKEKEFIGSKVVHEQIKNGPSRKLIAFEITGRGIPREKYEVQKDGKKIGEVTSGTFSPTLKKGIGMALVESETVSIGDEISVIIRNKPYEALVVKRPFISYRGGEK